MKHQRHPPLWLMVSAFLVLVVIFRTGRDTSIEGLPETSEKVKDVPAGSVLSNNRIKEPSQQTVVSPDSQTRTEEEEEATGKEMEIGGHQEGKGEPSSSGAEGDSGGGSKGELAGEKIKDSETKGEETTEDETNQSDTAENEGDEEEENNDEERPAAENLSPQHHKISFTKAPPGSGYQAWGGRLPRDHLGRLSSWWNMSPDKCIAQGEPDIPDEDQWIRRAPHFLILGGMKCGSQALTNYLWQHPRISKIRAVEVHFFDNKAPYFVNALGVRRKDARELYQLRFKKLIRDSDFFFEKDSNMVAFDSTPRYLLDADRNPAMMMCVCPWAKLIAVLRNPIDRIASHYNYLNQARKKNDYAMVDWNVWVEDDMQSLREAGIVANRTKEEFEQFSGSEEEVEAWKKYVRAHNSQFVVGRGLYAIQIRQWLAAIDKAEKPRSDLLLVQSEKLRSNTKDEYNRILAFLGLEEHDLTDAEPKHITDPGILSMPDDLRKRLEAFYAPYNQQLYDLLGYEWKGVWDPKMD